MATRAEIDIGTLRDFENGSRTLNAHDLDAIKKAFFVEGIEFNYHSDGKPFGHTRDKRRLAR